MQEREEVAGELLEAHRDAAESFDALEEALHKVSLFVQVNVDLALARAVGFRRDDDRAAVGFE